MSTGLLIFYAFLPVLFLVVLTFFLGKASKNYSVVDATWSLSFAVQALVLGYFSSGNSERKWILLTMLALWSLRLGFFLTRRIYRHHPHVDSRYEKLQEEYGENYHFRFFLFYLMQAVSVSVLTIPLAFAVQNPGPIGVTEWAGLALWLLSVGGESLADHQMNVFKSNPANKGKTCDVGLWRYSRHPNYFFESLIWWAYFIVCAGVGIWWGAYSPLIILFLLLKVTGVPPSEEQALKNRGDEYRRYQQKTSVFVPWFPKD